MLWTDSLFISDNDITRIDSEVATVAIAENITLDGDNGAIKFGIEEAAIELQKMMVAYGGYLNSGDLSANHLAAVLNVGIGNSVRQKAVLNQICVSGFTPSSWNVVKNWAMYWFLRSFYRNAFARTVNDRYEKKMTFYKEELTRRVTPSLYGLGLPIVLQPLAAPASYFNRNSGTWGAADVNLVAGPGTLNDTSVDVTITYVDQSQANRYTTYLTALATNAESDSPPRVTIGMTTGMVLKVDINNLNPPTGAQDPAQILTTVMAPMVATSFNIYVGPTGGPLYLQNLTPIPITTLSYTLPGDPTFSGYQLAQGQYQNRSLSLQPIRQRG